MTPPDVPPQRPPASRRGWSARSSWLLLVGLLPALHVLGSCMRDDDPATDSTPAGTEAEGDADTGASPTTSAAPDDSAADDSASSDAAVAFAPPEGNPESLAEWNQLEIADGRLVTLDDVTPYTLSSALFTDYAHKLRTVWLPADADPAAYDDEATFDFPVGTVITKTFYYPTTDAVSDAQAVVKSPEDPAALVDGLDTDEVRLIETRVLTRRDDGWHAFPYVWNEDETEATLQRTGDIQRLTLVAADVAGDDVIDEEFTYVVPDVNQCANCHAVDHSAGDIQPIGPKARHLDIDVDLGTGEASQLAAWIDRGIVSEPGSTPDADTSTAVDWTDDAASIDDRARAYLDINCAHCHNPAGAADTSGLFLERTTEVGLPLGICKTPIAAGTGTGGRQFDIVPGAPDESIFTYRMESTDPAAMMPELGRSLAHDEGLQLIVDWIAGLPGSC